MKIISLAVENIMKIRAAFIKPTDDVVLIQGDNGAGKSSILDAIVFAFKGDRELPAEPVRKGAKKGNIKIHMDGDPKLDIPPFVITRTITDKRATLKIEPAEILHGETPRSFMDKIIGSISFDPLAFINNDSKKQRKILLELIGVDVDELDRSEKEVFDERTVKGRELKAAEIKVKGLNRWPEVKEKEEIKMGELSDKLSRAYDWNQDIKNRESINQRLKDKAIINKNMIEGIKGQIKDLQTELEHLESLLTNQRKEYQAEKEAISKLEPIDMTLINQEMTEIEIKNSKIRDNSTHQLENANLKAIQAQYDTIDTVLESIRASRLKLIADASIPVEGLTFDEDGLLYNDIPLAQCSDGEKLMVSMGISMALNPTMRVLRIKDGSLLGKKNMEILSQMVKDKGYQVFIERVADKDSYDATGKVGLFIEEGEPIEWNGVMVEKEPELIETPKSNKKTKAVTKQPLPDEEW